MAQKTSFEQELGSHKLLEKQRKEGKDAEKEGKRMEKDSEKVIKKQSREMGGRQKMSVR